MQVIHLAKITKDAAAILRLASFFIQIGLSFYIPTNIANTTITATTRNAAKNAFQPEILWTSEIPITVKINVHILAMIMNVLHTNCKIKSLNEVSIYAILKNDCGANCIQNNIIGKIQI